MARLMIAASPPHAYAWPGIQKPGEAVGEWGGRSMSVTGRRHIGVTAL